MRTIPTVAVLILGLIASCGGDDDVDSNEAARAAYLGLDGAIAKAINLGFDGFNAATSANIPDQMTTGDVAGTLTVSGQVDAGASANKEMRLRLTLVDYQDDVPDSDLNVVYDTDGAAPPALDLSLRDIPSGTLTGTLLGDVFMEGDVTGGVTLDLMIDGMIEPDPMDASQVRRVPGTTTIRGTATSSYGTFDVDVTI